MASVRCDVRWVGAACALLIGCGGSQPSSELVDARRSYDEAAHSSAKELVPDKVLAARQALDRAEAAHEDSAGSFDEKSLAYIAQRQAMLAMAQGGIAKAQRDLEAADQKFKETSENLRKRAESSATSSKEALKENQQQLDKVRQQLNSQGDQLSAQAQDLKKKEKELEARQKELEGEKSARLDAEKKAAAAMASLAEIAKIKEEQRGMVITLDGAVLFASGKATLLPIAENKLGSGRRRAAEPRRQQEDRRRRSHRLGRLRREQPPAQSGSRRCGPRVPRDQGRAFIANQREWSRGKHADRRQQDTRRACDEPPRRDHRRQVVSADDRSSHLISASM